MQSNISRLWSELSNAQRTHRSSLRYLSAYDRAVPPQFPHEVAVGGELGGFAEHLRAEPRAVPADVELVLDADEDAVEEALRVAGGVACGRLTSCETHSDVVAIGNGRKDYI